MNKEINLATLIFTGFIALLWLEKPLREFLVTTPLSELNAKFLAGIIVRISLFAAAIFLIKKLRLHRFASLDNLTAHKNIHAVTIPLLLIIMGIWSNLDIYFSSPSSTFILFFISVLAVGFLEEFIFRGTIFPLFIKSLKNKPRPIIKSAVFSSLLFGLIHYINLFRQPGNLIGISSQVFFALSIGVFFCGLMVRTENILIPAIIHALINFSFGAGELQLNTTEISEGMKEKGINWNSIIPTTLFFSFILAGGIFMILKSDQKHVIDKCS